MFWKKPGPPQPQSPPPEVIKEQMRQQFEAQQADADRKFEVQKLQQTWQYEQQQTQMQQQFEAQKQQVELAFKEWMVQIQETAKAEIVQVQETNKADVAVLQDETKRTIAQMQALLDAQQMKLDAEMAESREENARAKTEKNLLGELGGALSELAQKLDGKETIAIQRIKGPDGKLIGGRIVQADGKTRDVNIK